MVFYQYKKSKNQRAIFNGVTRKLNKEKYWSKWKKRKAGYYEV